jgi:hypothetical protein
MLPIQLVLTHHPSSHAPTRPLITTHRHSPIKAMRTLVWGTAVPLLLKADTLNNKVEEEDINLARLRRGCMLRLLMVNRGMDLLRVNLNKGMDSLSLSILSRGTGSRLNKGSNTASLNKGSTDSLNRVNTGNLNKVNTDNLSRDNMGNLNKEVAWAIRG